MSLQGITCLFLDPEGFRPAVLYQVKITALLIGSHMLQPWSCIFILSKMGRLANQFDWSDFAKHLSSISLYFF